MASNECAEAPTVASPTVITIDNYRLALVRRLGRPKFMCILTAC
jgi:hypothetical protein